MIHKTEIEILQRQLNLTISISNLGFETKTSKLFIAGCLEEIVRSYGFSVSQYWTIDENKETLSCSDIWFSIAAVPEFRRASTDRKMSKGVGLPGRAWAIGAPLFCANLSAELGTSFPRREVAVRTGLMSGLAVPLRNGPMTIGIAEFYSFVEMEERTDDLLFLSKISGLIGGIVEEKTELEYLRHDELFTKRVLNESPVATVVIDRHGMIRAWNGAAERLFGWSTEEALDAQLSELIIPQRHRQAHNEGLLRYLRNKKSIVLDKAIRTPALHRSQNEIAINMHIKRIEYPKESFAFAAYITQHCDTTTPDITLV